MSLKNKLHKALIKEQHNRDSILLENRIIENNFSIISKNIDLKNDTDVFNLIENVISKINTFSNKNFSEQLIKENLIKLLDGLYGGMEPGFHKYWRSKVGSWITNKLELSDDVELNVISEIEKLSDSETEELFMPDKCPIISEKIADGVIKSLTSDSTTFKIQKNIMSSVMKDSSFKNKLKSEIMDYICPLISKKNEDMEKLEAEIRNSILGKENNT